MRQHEIELLAEHLFPRVARKGEKAAIGENYRVTALCRVGNHHRHSRRLGGDDKRAKVYLKALDFGFSILLLIGLVRSIRHISACSDCPADIAANPLGSVVSCCGAGKPCAR
jgi:hypothetical protein